MSEEQDVNVTAVDAVTMAADGDVNGFKSAINDLLMDKIADAVEVKRFEVQSNFMPAEAEQPVSN
jgi:hypothetical protein